MSLKIYFASPLFSVMEQEFNAKVVGELRATYGETVDIYLPQENSDINDKNGYADSIAIAKGDTAYLDKADVVIAVLDGALDAGVSAEVGYAFAKNKVIIGLYTDSRQQGATNVQKLEALNDIAESQFPYVNLYVIGLIKQKGKVVNTVKDLIETVGKHV